MRITVIDSRTLAVALVQPENDRYFNWNTGQWEAAPFVPANHARPLKPMEAAPSVMATVQYADIGGELLSRPDADAVIYSVSGSTYTPVDVWPIPLAPYHCAGGFSRL